ncbi:MAG: nitroreductase family protein [Clostridiales Family XIII bacterium]|jgi:nitroreductase|nr:nitroreductase family protein [Clostridiales Family XIII bacterium]
MEFMELVGKRQSVRRYKEGDVPVSDIEKMVDAARTAPSGKNSQPWHFIAIKDRGLIQRVAEAVTEANEAICKKLDAVDGEKAERFRKFVRRFTLFFEDAPALIAVMSREYEPTGYREIQLAGMDPSWLRDEKNPGMQSLGAAIEHLCLRAIELGYGSCWLTSANYADKGIAALMRDEAGFDEPGSFLAALISLGLPEDNPKSPPKKALSEILTVVE